MTYYVAKSNLKNDQYLYLCINSNMRYKWFKTLAEIRPYGLSNDSHNYETIQDWLDNLPNTTMTLLYSFTEQSHPELFI